MTASSLPRETRDTLLVLGIVTLLLLPQVAYLPLWASAFALAILGWRLSLLLRHLPLPKTWLLGCLLGAAIAATLAQYQSIVGPQAGVLLVVLLLVLKTLEMRARRDAMVIFFLGFFTLLTLFLQSQSLGIAACMLLGVWGLLACLVNAHMPAGYPSLRQLLRTSGLLMLLGAPVMLVLFVSFPRLPPLWGLPMVNDQASTGLSEDMRVGQVADLAQDHSVALRVRFDSHDGAPPAQQPLYFRGPVLQQFDGRNWRVASAADTLVNSANTSPSVTSMVHPVGYTLTLEPHQQRWLLALDGTLTPPNLPAQRLLHTNDLQWLSRRPVTEVLRYSGHAYAQYQYGLQSTPQQLRPLLELPANRNPRTQALAQQLKQMHGDNATAIVQAALQRLRTGGYVYTLQPDIVQGMDTADTFWFDAMHGFCEHIASAFAVLMRAAGIPARIVTGYHGGERNPIDGLWTVRQSDAHAWTEVWIEGQGWVRVDPTTAVAPARTLQLQRLTLPHGTWTSAIYTAFSPALLERLRAQWEAINHRWNDWVLNYTPRDQRALLQRLGWQNWSVTTVLTWVAAIAGLATVLWVWLRWQRQRATDPWLGLMQRARQKLTQQGLLHTQNQGPAALAAAVQAQWGAQSQPIAQWLIAMEYWRYAPRSANTPSLTTLRRQWRTLAWPRPRTP